MIKVKLHTISALKKIVGQRELEISLPQGSTLEALLSCMVKTWGKRLSDYMFQPGSTLPFPYIRLMINGQDIEFLSGIETLLRDGDEVLIIPPVAGG